MLKLLVLLLASVLYAAPILPPTGSQIQVSTTAQLVTAVNTATKGQTIMMADGDYNLVSVLPLQFHTDSVMLYGASKDPTKVRLHGGGFGSSNSNEEIIKIFSKGIRLAYFTLRDGRANGLKIQSGGSDNLLVHAVNFTDICERSIKAPDQAISYNGEIRYCLFEQVTAITLSIPGLVDSGNYIAGMDAMKIDGWNIHDNVFKNIRGRTGGGRAGIFLWNGCKHITVERNVFTGCDRAIALGNSANTNSGMDSGFIRNNFITANKDISIESWNSFGNRITGNQINGAPAYFRTLSLGNNGPNVFSGNVVQGKISLISGLMPDTVGNLWITDVSVLGTVPVPGSAPAPKAETVFVQLPAPKAETVFVQLPAPKAETVFVHLPAPPPDTIPRVCPPSVIWSDTNFAICLNPPPACPAFPPIPACPAPIIPACPAPIIPACPAPIIPACPAPIIPACPSVPACPAFPIIPACPAIPQTWILKPDTLQ